MNNIVLLEKIKILRKNKKFSQNVMAENLSMSQENYSKIENGKQIMTLEDFIEICKILEISPKSLIDPSSKEIFLNDEDIENIKIAKAILEKIEEKIIINQTFNINNINNEGNMIIGNKIDKKD